MQSRIRAVIFDLGNVLVDFDHMIAARRICAFTDKTAEEMYRLFFDSELTGLFEEGKIAAQDFFAQVKELLGLSLSFNEFLPIWNEIFFLSEKNKSVYDIAKKLKKNYKVALLSNVNILHFEYLKNKFPVFDAFHQIITSYESGMRKPHPVIYQNALSALGEKPPFVFYTDDREDLINGASSLGIRAFQFKTIEKLKEDLNSVGVRI